MPYFIFTYKFVLRSGGIDKYQDSFLEMVEMAAPDMAKNHVYLYTTPSREVYMTSIVQLLLMKTFEKFNQYLTPIKKLSHYNLPNIKKFNSVTEHLKRIIPGITVALRSHPSDRDSRVIYCSNTGSKIAAFRNDKTIKIYYSQHHRKIYETMERFKLLASKGVISPDKDSSEEITKALNRDERRHSCVELREYQKIKRALNIIVKDENILALRYLAEFKKICRFEEPAVALSELFVPTSNDLKEVIGVIQDESYIIGKINSLTHSHYPVPVYQFDWSGLMKDGNHIVCLPDDSLVKTPKLDDCKVDGEKVTYMGIPVIISNNKVEAEAADEFVSVADQK